jgi:ribonuclease HI
VHFVLEVLTRSKKYYSEMEKICYAVAISARKLWHYFEAPAIKVLTNQSLNDIFSNRDSSGRISKWVMELSVYVVDFEKRSAIKSHILADFVAEWTESGSSKEGTVLKSSRLVYCNVVWGNVWAGAATILISPSGIKLCYASRLQFSNRANKCTNKIAEYEAMLLGFRKLRAIGVQTYTLRTDSKIIGGQIEKECIAREPTLKRYSALVRRMECYFKGFIVEYVKRTKNSKANELAMVAAHNTPLLPDVFFQVVLDTSIKTFEAELRVMNLI